MALATFANQYLQQGTLIYIGGKLRSRKYEDKEGHKKYVTEVVADRILILEKKIKATEEGIEEISNEALPFNKRKEHIMIFQSSDCTNDNTKSITLNNWLSTTEILRHLRIIA